MPNGVFLNILVVSQFKLPNFTLAFFFFLVNKGSVIPYFMDDFSHTEVSRY